MNIRELLNVLVLTLSLATILITLLTYLIHKIRQLPKSESQDSAVKSDGVFFKRYLGRDVDVVKVQILNEEKSNVFLRLQKSGSRVFFALLCLVIFCSIAFERGLSSWKRTEAKKENSETFKARVASGLLKEFDFNPSLENPKLAESITLNQKQRASGALTMLKGREIVLVNTEHNLLSNQDSSGRGVRLWQKFLAQMGLRYRQVSNFADFEKADLIILPEAKSLSPLERSTLIELAKSGVGILTTGPVGYLDEKGGVATIPWGKEIWDLSYHSNEDAKSYFPTLFSGGIRAPWWDAPPGLLVNWFPTDNGFQYTSAANGAMAYESNYQGRWRSHPDSGQYVRAVFGSRDGLRMTWLALDPPELEKMSTSDRFYIRSLIVESLLWSAGAPIAKIGLWKHGFEGAFVASVDSEDQFTNANSLLKIFKQEKTPATFFVVSNLLKEHPELIDGAGPEIEIASHTDDHSALEGKPLLQQFQHIQNSRLAIEYLWGRAINGFRPPEEGFDGATLNGILQNKLSYIFGDQHFHRFAPVLIADGNLTYFPRSALDDFNLFSKFGSYSTDLSVNALSDDYSRIARLGGAHLLSLHTQIYGRPENRELVRTFVRKISEDKTWKTNFEEIWSWWQQREKIRLTTQVGDGGSLEVKVLNENDHAVEDVVIQLDDTNQRTFIASDRFLPMPEQAQARRWLIKKLKAGEELSLGTRLEPVQRTPAVRGKSE